MKKNLQILLLLFLIWNATEAQIIYESFNYTSSQDVGGTCTTGTCSNNNWTTVDGSAIDGGVYTVGSGTLTYEGLASPGGNKLNIFGLATGTNVRDVLRPINGLNSNVVYASFLLNVLSATGLNQTMSDVNTFVHFGSGNTAIGLVGAVLGRLSIKRNGTTSYNLGIVNNTTGTPVYSTYSTNLNFGQTYFIVLKYDNTNGATTAHTMSLWVNPSSSNFSGVEPTPDAVNNSGSNTTPGPMTSFVLRATGQSPNAEFDELRIGTTWADVTPPRVLPVDLISFNGYSSKRVNYLNWRTASESNNAYFEVWKKNTDESDFKYVERVQGNKNSNQLNSYSFQDEQVNSASTYYQLRQIDLNGITTIFPQIVAIKTNLFNHEIVVSVNEGQTSFLLNALSAGSANFIIYNFNGQRIDEKSINITTGYNEIKVFGNLSRGKYIMVAEFDGKKHAVKFINP